MREKKSFHKSPNFDTNAIFDKKNGWFMGTFFLEYHVKSFQIYCRGVCVLITYEFLRYVHQNFQPYEVFECGFLHQNFF